jgi:hypothetical protein
MLGYMLREFGTLPFAKENCAKADGGMETVCVGNYV